MITKPLTKRNAKVGTAIRCKAHPEWGLFMLMRDRNGWTHRAANGNEAMLDEGEFRFWEIVVDIDGPVVAVRARYESMRFTFEAYGATREKAADVLRAGWKARCERRGTDPDTFTDDDISYHEIRLDTCYLDDEEVH